MTRQEFIGSIITDALAACDDYLVDDLDPKTGAAILAAARRRPSIRKSLAQARMMRDAAPPREAKTQPTTVYFIRRGARGPVKIGVAANPSFRIRELQTACAEPLTIIGTRPGGITEERRLHRQFAAHRMRGEWFRPVREILAAAKGAS